MEHEIGGLGEGTESVVLGEGTSEAKEADIVRVKESLQAAQQLRGRIRAQSAQDGRFAVLLSRVFQEIDDERLLVAVYQQLVVHRIDPGVICAEFLPFLMGRIDIGPRRELFPQWLGAAQEMDSSEEGAIAYLLALWKDTPSLQTLPGDEYVRFVYYYFHGTGIIDLQSWDAERKNALLDRLAGYFLVEGK